MEEEDEEDVELLLQPPAGKEAGSVVPPVLIEGRHEADRDKDLEGLVHLGRHRGVLREKPLLRQLRQVPDVGQVEAHDGETPGKALAGQPHHAKGVADALHHQAQARRLGALRGVAGAAAERARKLVPKAPEAPRVGLLGER